MNETFKTLLTILVWILVIGYLYRLIKKNRRKDPPDSK